MQQHAELRVICSVFLLMLLAKMNLAQSARVACVFACVSLCIAPLAICPMNTTYRIDLLASDGVNESIIVKCKLNGEACMFMIDTGYAGPPVISSSYLAAKDTGAITASQEYGRVMRKIQAVSLNEQHAAIDRFLKSARCHAYTSGCTMRLMGIGETVEQQADMLLCPALELKTVSGHYHAPKLESRGAIGDVFVTHALPSSVHILTCDFLLHAAPAVLWMRGQMELNVHALRFAAIRAGFHMLPMRMSGGSFVVTIQFGNEPLAFTVDTGSPVPICIGSTAAAKLRQCKKPKGGRMLRQMGVNGEDVCSEMLLCDVGFCGKIYRDSLVFANNMQVEQVDGYVGMGFLRAFNICVTANGIGFSNSGLPMRSIGEYNTVTQAGGCKLPLDKCSVSFEETQPDVKSPV